MSTSTEILATLERDGVVVLENFLEPEAVQSMQKTMQSHLNHGCWNSPFGYTNEDNYRMMVEDVLTMDENFQRAALLPRLLPVFQAYLGAEYTLCEAKAWRSLPSTKDFHGWHNDAWYDHKLPEVPRQLKLAIYLTDVSSGAFGYIRGTHGQTRHRHWPEAELQGKADRILTVTGKAGTMFLFDTSGIHRQTYPILTKRDAVFLCYNDPRVPLQAVDISYYRYHPLHLNAAFLGGLSAEEQRVLGFGNKTLLQNWYVRPPNHPYLERFLTALHRAFIPTNNLVRRLQNKLRS